LNFEKPKPLKARPKLGFAGQARPAQHYQQVVVVVELLVSSDIAVEHALALQVMQLTVQLNWLEDYDRSAEEKGEVLLAE
jgi:hypothetical protein